MSAELSTRVYDIKSFIANSLAISPTDILLTVNGVFLEDDRTLREYSINELDSLQLHLPINFQKIIYVRVVISPEEVYSIPIRSNSTVASLRSEICKRTSNQYRDSQNIFLIYSHYILEDSRTLDEYGITDDAGITIAHTLDSDKLTSTEPYDYCDDFKSGTISASCPRMISVHFLLENGDPFTVALDPSKPLKSASSSVELKTGIPTQYQGFILSGKKVDSEKTLEELAIVEGESLYLNDERVREIYPTKGQNCSSKMMVTFDLGRHRIRMTVPSDCTVNEVQQVLQTHKLISGQKIDLFLHDSWLDPRKYLHECGITNESVVRVVTRFL